MTRPGDPQRVRIGIVLARQPVDLGEWLADGAAFDAAGADALWVDPVPELDPLALAAALTSLTYRSLLVVAVPSPAPARTITTVRHLSRGRLRILAEESGSWTPVDPPDGRAAWQATLLDAAQRGPGGVLVPAGPRLLDLLRNPDDPGQRLDLHLAQG